MDECYKCHTLGERTLLFEAVFEDGIIKICRKCSSKENIPIIKKPNTLKLSESEKNQTVYDRISKISGVNKEQDIFKQKKELLKKQETNLKGIIDRNFGINFKQEEEELKDDLINNFHWVIMRARRSRKLTQEQLAKEIEEPVIAIQMAEKGILPEDNFRFVNKLESFLKIRLLKEEVAERIKKEPKKLDLNKDSTRELTISDLQEMKEERESRILGNAKDGGIFDGEIDDLILEKK
ncbi:MAG: hypothetical protein QF567_02535 [Candidatus Pacearchaeota archaeon]|jgi:ribosome-binding protein aMBF1 (putative translation factor)|nr:hypothetical protein [Candidatus Pacearchaeota archaeon]MDP7521084.1 hypothetical protein [Candidatus Pacearchaeota archaeon]|tara:strand:+ start:5197 stop:5907 length:711 start_codon:yes stop_codon:yes gene_type:complete